MSPTDTYEISCYRTTMTYPPEDTKELNEHMNDSLRITIGLTCENKSRIMSEPVTYAGNPPLKGINHMDTFSLLKHRSHHGLTLHGILSLTYLNLRITPTPLMILS